MRFDDRLTTVLSQPVGSPHDRAVRWRQLVDLVARSGGQVDLVLLEQALAVIRTDSRAVREPIRAAAARSIAGSPIPLALLALFATDKLAVAAPLIASASLTGDALAAVRAGASQDVRRFLDSLSRPPVEEQAPLPPIALLKLLRLPHKLLQKKASQAVRQSQQRRRLDSPCDLACPLP